VATEPPQPPDQLKRPVVACPDYQDGTAVPRPWVVRPSSHLLRPETVAGAANHKAADAGILVIIQEVFDIPFVPPLDVLTGTVTSLQSLKERNWSALDPDAFTRLKAASSNGDGGLA